jgi:hypothetical protein
MTDPRIEFTRHAREMLAERGIRREWVNLTILDPAAIEPDPSRPGVLRAFRRIAERGNLFLRVVYTQAGETVRVITVFFDRGRR